MYAYRGDVDLYRFWLVGLVAAFLGLVIRPVHAGHEGYYQWPALHEEALVFASEGDLWITLPEGGHAVRLTSHIEPESHAFISPDGKWIALNAFYDGPDEVYVMPVAGGTPKRLTFEGGNAIVRGWASNSDVLFSSSRVPGPDARLLKTVNLQTGALRDLPLADAELASYSARHGWAFARHGLSWSGDNAVLYRGGLMSQLWLFDPANDKEARRLLADFDAPIRFPMWQGDRIYFVSDKSGADNIWSVNASGEDLIQHSSFEGWQIKSPQIYGNKIVYQKGADIFRFNLENGREHKFDLTIVSDRDYRRSRVVKDPLSYLDDARMSPNGKSVVVTARGKIAVGFTGEKRRIELNVPDNVRARSACFGTDSKHIYALLDQGQTNEIWRFQADGQKKPEQVTANTSAHIFALHPSPKNDRLLFNDKEGRLWSYDTKSNTKTLIDTTESTYDDSFHHFSWSPHGRYVAYTYFDARDISRIAVYDFKTNRREVVVSGKFASFSPAFSHDGAWLYFISDRRFVATADHPWTDRVMGTHFARRGKLYALQLDPKAEFPFQVSNELLESKSKSKNADAKSDREIDFNGLKERLWVLPTGAGDYRALAANKDYLYILDGEDGALYSLEIDRDSDDMNVFADNVWQFDLSSDRKDIFVQTGYYSPRFYLATASSDLTNRNDAQVRFIDWRPSFVPSQEWHQMMEDAWRLHRAFAYDRDMRGVDWNKVYDKYFPFVQRLGHRSELDDLLAQMIAELGMMHSQIDYGDEPYDLDSGADAFLDAAFEPVPQGLKIKVLYQAEKDRPSTIGPLQRQNVKLRVGDIITSVDGSQVGSLRTLSAQLKNKHGQQVRLDILREKNTQSVIVEPIGWWTLRRLRYSHWVEQNRSKVNQRSKGEIGYLHLRGMEKSDIASFTRDFFEHFDKDGLIIDVRGNTGGYMSSWIISTLLRQVWSTTQAPHGGRATGMMHQTFRGHLAVLINEGTYSDGENFAAGIKTLDIGTLIGTRTAGAGASITERNRLSDGGLARVSEAVQFGLDGRWIIEGRGVSPDIEVVNMPVAAYNGHDAQLEAAIMHLQNKITAEPIPPLERHTTPPLGNNASDIQ